MEMLIVINKHGNKYAVLDTDDMVVEVQNRGSIKLPVAGMEESGIHIINSPNSEHIFFNNSVNWYPDFTFNIHMTKSYGKLSNSYLLAEYAIKGDYKFQLAVLDSMNPLEDSENLYLTLINIYSTYKDTVSVIKNDKFKGCTCFSYNGVFYISDGVDYISCPINALNKYFDKFRKLTKASLLCGLKFSFLENTLIVDSNKDTLTLFDDYNYYFRKNPTEVEVLRVYGDNIQFHKQCYQAIWAKNIYFYSNSLWNMLDFLGHCGNHRGTTIYCKKPYMSKIRDEYPLLAVKELC
jgi:hypothetical protein